MKASIISQPYSGAAEIPAIARLFALCEAHDQTSHNITEQDIQNDYSAPGYDPTRFVHLWRHEDGTLIGCAEMWPPQGEPGQAALPEMFWWYVIHPEFRAQGLEEATLRWGQTTCNRFNQERNEQLVLQSMAHSTEAGRIAFLEANGFEIARIFYTMDAALQSGMPLPELPEGMSLKMAALTPAEFSVLRNEIWVDHYGFQPLSAEKAAHERQQPSYSPELDLTLHDSDGRPVGFCMSTISAEENELLKRKIGWIHRVGVRREYRGQGLGRVLLRAGMASILAAGMDSVRLGVDASNATGALQLYSSEGFEVISKWIRYVRHLQL